MWLFYVSFASNITINWINYFYKFEYVILIKQSWYIIGFQIVSTLEVSVFLYFLDVGVFLLFISRWILKISLLLIEEHLYIIQVLRKTYFLFFYFLRYFFFTIALSMVFLFIGIVAFNYSNVYGGEVLGSWNNLENLSFLYTRYLL